MKRFSCLKNLIGLGIFFIVLGISAGHYQMRPLDAFAQERDKKSESKGTHTSDKLAETGEDYDKAKDATGKAMDWVADKMSFFTDWVDSIVGIESDNKGTNALFGLPIYVFVGLVGLFALKMTYNIVRDMLKSMFGKTDGRPTGRHRR